MAFDDFGFDLGGDIGGAVGGLTDLPMGGLPSGLPMPDFGNAGASFFPGEGSSPGAAGIPMPAGGDGGSGISGFLKDAMPLISGGLRLGTGALGAFTGINALNQAGKQQAAMDRAQRTSEAAAAPGVAAAGELIPAGTKALMGGPLPPELEATVNTFVNNEKMKARQMLAKMGLTNSDAAAQMDAYIEQQAMEVRAKLASGLLQSGTGAIPPGVTGQAGQIASNQSSTINQALQEANKAMFNLLGQQG